MELLKKHVDTVIVLGGILASVLWMNGKFSDVDKKFTDLEKDVLMIKTILIMKNIMPVELASAEKVKISEG